MATSKKSSRKKLASAVAKSTSLPYMTGALMYGVYKYGRYVSGKSRVNLGAGAPKKAKGKKA